MFFVFIRTHRIYLLFALDNMTFVLFSSFPNPSFLVLSFRYVLFFLARSTFVKSTCYFPNGTPSEDIPCTTNSSVDYCCGKNSMCFTNKVCLNFVGTLDRGSCTDKTWNSSACPFFCLSGNCFNILKYSSPFD